MMPRSGGKYARADADYWQQQAQEYRHEPSLAQGSSPRLIQLESEAETQSDRGAQGQQQHTFIMEGPNAPEEKTRRKSGASTGHIACDFCRQRKLRCTGDKPRCEACVTRDQECSYVPILRRRGPGKKRDKVGARRRPRTAPTDNELEDANSVPLSPPIRWRREGPRGGPSAELPLFDDPQPPTAPYHHAPGYAADSIARPQVIGKPTGEAHLRPRDDVPAEGG
ncbi:uncharacterized protein SCHCODRAFT_02615671 [Schizophyllum commune H4-8]|uniref:uncharacterized protein n=1 Tax=Schizophyllum commune (strain H4-8 / FGSC 9210) TaxID=578458 RepID=UPI002160068D|nr:uncharacterized protein SCHCODRAFT_02615671 [Schizophyllum commune H4-8]KAI5896733.1 hypothetical protein SCHCODRAFT_02615671 [Schizophyllum commune H4-8]